MWTCVPVNACTRVSHAHTLTHTHTQHTFPSLLFLKVINPKKERHSFVFFFYPSYEAGIPAVAEEDAWALSRYSLLSSQVRQRGRGWVGGWERERERRRERESARARERERERDRDREREKERERERVRVRVSE
jgi:hypothetical protein